MNFKIKNTILTLIYLLFFQLCIPAFAFTASSGENNVSLVSSSFKILFYLIIFILVIVFAFYGTKIIAKKSSSFLLKSEHIEIIDYINLGNSTKIYIIKLIDNVYVISINNNQTTLIDKLENYQVFESETSRSTNYSFQNYLFNFINKGKTNDRDNDLNLDGDININDKLLDLKNKLIKIKKKSSPIQSNDEDEYHEKS